MLHVPLDDGAELALPTVAGRSAFVMPIFGTVEVDGRRFSLEDLALPAFQAREVPHVIKLKAVQGSAKAMVFAGNPHRLA